jgi:hypothetical protein
MNLWAILAGLAIGLVNGLILGLIVGVALGWRATRPERHDARILHHLDRGTDWREDPL